MFKRKQSKHRKLKLLRKLTKPKDPTVAVIFREPDSNTGWVIKVKGERRNSEDIDKEDKKALAYALLETATDSLIREAEAELANLKGDRTKQATTKRKELKNKINHLQRYKRRLYGLDSWPPTEIHTE